MKKTPELQISKIRKVKEYKDHFSVTKDDGWSVAINKKHGVTPKVGDTIAIRLTQKLGTIMGIQINDKELFSKTELEIDKEKRKWLKETRKRYEKEYRELMEKIKNEEPFRTIDISGMGGGYERNCQLMLRAGIKFLHEHPDFHFDYQHFKNIYGLAWTDTPWGKELDKTVTEVAPGCTGAMHQAVISHLMYIHKHGYEKWLESAEDRQYIYPIELPEPSFGKN